MSDGSFLELQYKLSKTRLLRKSSHSMSFRNRQNSWNSKTFEFARPEMMQVFERFDHDRDGKISRHDYEEVLKKLGEEETIDDLPRIFQAVDLDNDGFIDFEEFLAAHERCGGVRLTDMQNAFRAFDMNRDGKISAEEVAEMLRRLGEPYSVDDCRNMVKAIDSDGDGFVNMDEFIDMMTKPL